MRYILDEADSLPIAITIVCSVHEQRNVFYRYSSVLSAGSIPAELSDIPVLPHLDLRFNKLTSKYRTG